MLVCCLSISIFNSAPISICLQNQIYNILAVATFAKPYKIGNKTEDSFFHFLVVQTLVVHVSRCHKVQYRIEMYHNM